MDTYRQKVQGEQRNCSFRQVTLEAQPHSRCVDQHSKASLGVSCKSDWPLTWSPQQRDALFFKTPEATFICPARPAAGIQATVHLAPCVPAAPWQNLGVSGCFVLPRADQKGISALWPPPSVLRPLPSVLRPLPSALCPPPSALCVPQSAGCGLLQMNDFSQVSVAHSEWQPCTAISPAARICLRPRQLGAPVFSHLVSSFKT